MKNNNVILVARVKRYSVGVASGLSHRGQQWTVVKKPKDINWTRRKTHQVVSPTFQNFRNDTRGFYGSCGRQALLLLLLLVSDKPDSAAI